MDRETLHERRIQSLRVLDLLLYSLPLGDLRPQFLVGTRQFGRTFLYAQFQLFMRLAQRLFYLSAL